MKRCLALLLLLLALPALACSAPARLLTRLQASPTHTAASTPVPSATPLPSPLVPASPTPEPTAAQAMLIDKLTRENSPEHNFDIEAIFPYFPDEQPGAADFNAAISQFESAALAEFRQNAEQADSVPVEANNSFLQTRYDVLYNQNGLLSLRLWVQYYMKGAAHPGSFAATFTYDLQAQKMLALNDLFLAETDYLPALAAFCQAEITSRDPAFWPDGASPAAANYRNWNITPTGLLITFDEYQVAPYAAGPQEIEVPFSELIGLVDPQGPLGKVTTEFQ